MISIMLTWSMKQPSTSRTSIIAQSTTTGVSRASRITVTSPLVAPEKARICEKVVAPTMISRMTPEMPAVPSRP